MANALHHGEDTAEPEEHQADHEGMEVALPTSSERVLRVRVDSGPMLTEEQQPLVFRVGERLQCLGQWGR